MRRTQLYLEEEQMQRLKIEAAKAHKAVSEIIRSAIDYFLNKKAGEADWKNDSLTKAIGSIKLSSQDASIRHDEYLYGGKKS